MKKVFLILFMMIAFKGFSFIYDYHVDVVDNGISFQIKLRTLEQQNSMCSLVITDLYVDPPEAGCDGVFYMIVTRDPNGKCLMAFGPHKGCFSFKKGSRIPQGTYNLIINEEDYGFLVIDDNKAYLRPINYL